MNEVFEILEKNDVVGFATVENNKPRVRAFQVALIKEGTIIFCTANTKDVYKQLKASPYLEFTVTTPDYRMLRVSGKAEFVNDKDIKQAILDKNALVKEIYQTADNPVFETFSIKDISAQVFDLSVRPPALREY